MAFIACAVSFAATSREAAPLAREPELEARVLAIAHELRCLVCQNETIAASNASLAVDLREQIRQRLRLGETPEQIRDFMVKRYGQFVLYRPVFEPRTWTLWVGPFVMFAGALGIFGLITYRRSPSGAHEDESESFAVEGETDMIGRDPRRAGGGD